MLAMIEEFPSFLSISSLSPGNPDIINAILIFSLSLFLRGSSSWYLLELERGDGWKGNADRLEEKRGAPGAIPSIRYRKWKVIEGGGVLVSSCKWVGRKKTKVVPRSVFRIFIPIDRN